MMQMMVDNLDAWWQHIEALDLPKVFGVKPPKAPAIQPWGLRVSYVYDPSGVLWHVAERRQNEPADYPLHRSTGTVNAHCSPKAAVGTLRHLAAAQHFGRFRSEADIEACSRPSSRDHVGLIEEPRATALAQH
jgi:hypothetical protein